MNQDWPTIFDWAGLHVRGLVRACHGPGETTVLDVGAGQGKYRLLLAEYPVVDAVEIWQPYVDRFDLERLYRRVYVRDVREHVLSSDWTDAAYDVAILGDVLEHVPLADARNVLNRVYAVCRDVIVVVPYRYVQDEEDGNAYQRHVQDDLTPESMVELYPELTLVAVETRDWQPFKGIYRRWAAWPSSAGSD